MTHDLLLNNVRKHIGLDENETASFTALLSFKAVSKKSLLLREGEPCRNLYYVHSGALRAYHLHKSGKESTVMFAVADWWVTDMACFLTKKPAMMCIEAIEDSCLFGLSRESFENLFSVVPKFERFFRILMQNAYTREQVRVIENLSLPAEDRYESFLVRYPHIANAVTQKQIASYLGITPEFLSAVRKNRSKRQRS